MTKSIGASSTGDQIQYGGFWIRLLAVLLDGLVINAAMSFLFLGFGQKYGLFNTSNSLESVSNPSWQSLFSTAMQWIYFILMTKYYGATLGKMALGLKVVKAGGGELDWVTVILRETIAKFISALILGIGYLMVAWDPQKRAMHDKIAGTIVTKE